MATFKKKKKKNKSNINTTHLASPVKTIPEKWKLVPTYIKARGLVKQHIESFNYFINKGLQKIIKANAIVRFDEKPDIYLKYDSIRVGMPLSSDGNILTPQMCRVSMDTYCAPIEVDVSYPSTSNKNHLMQQKNIVIGYLPIMLHSSHCHLYNKLETELSSLGECIYDSGGYFIVNGREKVMLIQEQLAKNRIIIVHDDKLHSLTAHVTSATAAVKSRTSVYFKNDRILVKHNSLRSPVPISVLFRAMGIESDQEIVQLVGADLIDDLAPSLQQASELTVDVAGKRYNVETSTLAKIFIADRLTTTVRTQSNVVSNIGNNNNNNNNNKNEQDQSAEMKLLDKKMRDGHTTVKNLIFSHIEPRDGHNDILNKAIYLGLVIRRLIASKSNPDYIDDKDYYGNKRLELSGYLLSLLFEDKFKQLNTFFQRSINDMFKYGKAPARRFENNELPKHLVLGKKRLTEGINYAISTGNWSLGRFKMNKQGVTQQVSRLSYISAMGHMTRISSSVEKTRKTSGPRALHGSQWGVVCPSDTPEGQGCGLIKNLAMLCNISLDEDCYYIKKLTFCLGVEDIAILPHLFLNSNTCSIFTVWINGECIGVHRNCKLFVNNMRYLRRKNRISMFTSICINYQHRSILIATDQGRVCRPLIICKNGECLLKLSHITALKNKLLCFDDFVHDGIIEYLDVNEENNCNIALRESDINKLTTHLEIDPMTILGCVSGLIPFPHHNQSPRNTYQCAMGKQAMGIIGINKFERCDHLFYDLCYIQQPMVQTKIIQTINFNRIPAGCNAILAVMSFSGYDIEDAIILNKASLDRGFMRCVVNRTQDFDFNYYHKSKTNDRLARINPNENQYRVFNNSKLKSNDREYEYKYGDNYMALDKEGIAMPGATILAQRGVLAMKYVPNNANITSIFKNNNDNNTTDYYNKKCLWKHNNAANVDKVILTSNLKNINSSWNWMHTKPMMLKIVTREHRRPELGDKFSSRHGQKGVCGLIVPQRDMPFNDQGIVPDLIMNPHGFPSRMTVGKMIELITGKAGVLAPSPYDLPQNGSYLKDTQFGDGTAFGSRNIVSEVCSKLCEYGYSYTGKDYLTCGMTGNGLSSYIFEGPVFYQKLKHMVSDKMHARSRGPITTLTKQPTEGRSRKGGLRVGEMERDCLIGHGSSLLLYERLMISSDIYKCLICSKCGIIGQSYNKYCNYCNTNKYITSIQLPYAAKLLFQELISMNISPRVQLTDQT